MIKYSFIIPIVEINDYIRELIPKILEINRDDFEIILYPHVVRENGEKWDKTRQISSGNVGPAQKRDLAIRDARGEILVFIDDDSYPKNNFLDILDKDFNNESIGAIGGPAITPVEDSFWQKVSGAVFLSSFSGGNPERYASVGKKRIIADWPSVNLSVRKKYFDRINGFDSNFWPGEDTKLCLKLIEREKIKIIYDPELIVCHHRREGLARHLKQVGGYGLHRGFFAKKYPSTSFKLKYFIPAFFLAFILVGGLTSFFYPHILKLYLLGWGFYGLAMVKSIFDIKKYEKNNSVVINVVYYIFFTHIVYGFNFIRGFVFTKKLISKLR